MNHEEGAFDWGEYAQRAEAFARSTEELVTWIERLGLQDSGSAEAQRKILLKALVIGDGGLAKILETAETLLAVAEILETSGKQESVEPRVLARVEKAVSQIRLMKDRVSVITAIHGGEGRREG